MKGRVAKNFQAFNITLKVDLGLFDSFQKAEVLKGVCGLSTVIAINKTDVQYC